MEIEYLNAEDAARKMGVSKRTIRNLAEEYDWFGTLLGLLDVPGRPFVFLQSEIDRMMVTPRRSPGRPRKPIGEEAAMLPALPPVSQGVVALDTN